jgi:hypothetical protein
MREASVHRIATRSPDDISGPRSALTVLVGTTENFATGGAKHRSADGGGSVAIIAARRAGGAS